MNLMRRTPTLMMALLCAAGACSMAMAQSIHRIVGPDGKVTFSDRAPDKDAADSVVSPGPALSGAAAAGTASLPYELRQVASRFPVTLYTGPDCAPCTNARNLLVLRGVPFSERTVESNDDVSALQRLSGNTTLPLGTIGKQQLRGFSDAMIAAAIPLEVPGRTVDIVGTGGDRHRSVNVSTMASVIAAASGVPVAKHGNRAASSKSGSSDVLTALGVNLALEPDQLREAFDRTGIAFVHAARFLPGFRHVGPVRAELGVQTVFNYLGPLCNPVRPEATAAGVADSVSAARTSTVGVTR